MDGKVQGVARNIRNCSTTSLVGGWKRATIPPSSLAGGRRATEQNLRSSLYILEYRLWHTVILETVHRALFCVWCDFIGQETFCPATFCPRTYIVPGQYVAGTICRPMSPLFCCSNGRHFVPGDILSRFGKATFCPGRRIVPVGNKW